MSKMPGVMVKHGLHSARADPGLLNSVCVGGWGRVVKISGDVLTDPITQSIKTERSEQTTIWTQIRRRRTWRLIRVYTVCHSSCNFRHVLASKIVLKVYNYI